MNILMTGGTGFIGQVLCQRFIERGDQVTVLSRQPEAQVKALCGAPTHGIQQLDTLSDQHKFDVIINLAGAPIAEGRWSEQRKWVLCESRHAITRELVAFIQRVKHKPEVFISGSAVGYYGDQKAQRVTETTIPNIEFTHALCEEWEKLASEARDSTRVCHLRTGLVLGPSGGFLSKMWLPFKLGLGGRLGSGQQYMPWIHINDMVNIIEWLISRPEISGPVNATAPNPVTNLEFVKALAGIMRRPAIMVTPGLVLTLLLGELSRLLLTGQNAIPQKLLDAGFEFSFTSIDSALQDVSRNKGYFY